MLGFKVEQSKVPDYWGQKAKDTVTAIVFIRKIDDLARTTDKDQGHHRLCKCGQRAQGACPGLALCDSGNAKLVRRPTNVDKS